MNLTAPPGEEETDNLRDRPTTEPMAPQAGKRRDPDRRWRHEAAVGTPWRLPRPAEGRYGAGSSEAQPPRPVSRPFSVPHVCHRCCRSLGQWRPPHVFQVPGVARVAPWLTEAQAQAHTEERGTDMEWQDPSLPIHRPCSCHRRAPETQAPTLLCLLDPWGGGSECPGPMAEGVPGSWDGCVSPSADPLAL